MRLRSRLKKLKLSDVRQTECEQRTHEQKIRQLEEEQSRSINKIQDETFKAKQTWGQVVKRPLSLTNMNQVTDLLQNRLSTGTTNNRMSIMEIIGGDNFVPGMIYSNNGSIKVNRCKLQSVSKAQSELLKQLKASQKHHHTTLTQHGIALADDSHPVSNQNLLSFYYTSSGRRRSRAKEEAHACRGINGEIYKPDCGACQKLMSTKMKTLAKFQEATIGQSSLIGNKRIGATQSHANTWMPAPKGTWYSKEQSFVDAKRYMDSLPSNCSKETRNRAHVTERVALDSLLLDEPTFIDKIGYSKVSSVFSRGSRTSRYWMSSNTDLEERINTETPKSPSPRRYIDDADGLSTDPSYYNHPPDIKEERRLPNENQICKSSVNKSGAGNQYNKRFSIPENNLKRVSLPESRLKQKTSVHQRDSRLPETTAFHRRETILPGEGGRESLKHWEVKASLLETVNTETARIEKKVSNFLQRIEEFKRRDSLSPLTKKESEKEQVPEKLKRRKKGRRHSSLIDDEVLTVWSKELNAISDRQ